MSDVNELIIKRLKRYDPEVFELASRALSLAENLTEKSVAEQLEAVVRDLIKQKGEQE